MNILDEVTPRGRLGTTPHKAKVISLNLPFPLLPLGQKITYQQFFFSFSKITYCIKCLFVLLYIIVICVSNKRIQKRYTWQGVLDMWPSRILSWSSLRSELNMSSSPIYAQREWYLQSKRLFSKVNSSN